MLDQRTKHARALFSGIAPRYDLPAEVCSFGQYGRWRRHLVRALPVRPSDRVLDVATGTGLIARAIERRHGARVTGVDLTPAMLERNTGVNAAADARALPFADESFDVVTFGYLLRYVEDPQAQLKELARVLKHGGALGSVEFAVPRPAWALAAWRAYAMGVFPAISRAFGNAWRDVGGFLPASIVEWSKAWPIERQLAAWREAGIDPTHVKRLSFGGATVIVGAKR